MSIGENIKRLRENNRLGKGKMTQEELAERIAALKKLGRIEFHADLFGHSLLVGGEEIELLLVDIIHALELRTLIDRPRQGTHLDFQFLFQLVEQVEGVTTFTVHLVDEDDNGRLPHAANGHQLPRLSLHTLGTINHDDGRIDSR